MSDRHAAAPITDDDATIAAALEDVSIPTLLMSLVHLTGSTAILDELPRPAGIYLNEIQGFMDPADQATVRARAAELLAEFRDGGCVLPPGPSTTDLHQMMEVLVAGPVGEEYVPLIREELGLDPADTRHLDEHTPADEQLVGDLPDDFHAVIIGAGMSGLLAAIRFEAAGIPYTVIEKNPGVGGTWYENRYPGCRVDVGNHFYCYSFAPNNDWSRFFATHEELQAYFEDCADRYDVRPNIRFGTEVVRADWDHDTAAWVVEVRTAEGATEELRASIMVSAVGQLNRPKLPDIDGIESFDGEWCHSARWPDELDLEGKRVAVIGSGASAFQIVPTVAPETERLTVFQRSANWMFENPHYHDEVPDGAKWALRHVPFYGRWYRFLLFWPGCDGGLPAMRVDPEWPHQDRAISEMNDLAREVFTQYLIDQVHDDPELQDAVVPDYVCLGKRTLQDNGSWLAALQRDNVDLVADDISAITPTGVRTVAADGSVTDQDVDVIVYATGFHANRFLWPMDIVGRSGQKLADQWGDEPSALLGITVPDFPNLFCLYGPGTNLATGGSLIFHSECQMRYVMGCLELMQGHGWQPMACTDEAHDEYNDRLQAELDTMIWSHDSIEHSWYRGPTGKINILSPWKLSTYWQMTRRPDPDHFTFG